MNTVELNIIKNNILAQIQDKQVAPICIAGTPGTGKSTAVSMLAKELGFNLVTESAPTLSISVLSGLPNDHEAPQFQAYSLDGTAVRATVWSIPEMIAKTITASLTAPTILLLDDFHMVSQHLQSYFYALLLERRLGNYKLPDNVAIVLTMNDSDTAGFRGINSAVRNRLSILKIDFNFDYWFNSIGGRLHYLIASFLKAKPYYTQEPETIGIVGFATARVWTSLSKELMYQPEDTLLRDAHRIVGTQVSDAAAKAFQAHVAYIQALDFSKVVATKRVIDLSKHDPLDSIIYAYIVNFIVTVEEGMYLLDLLAHNIKNLSTTFVGFTFGEIYNKFTSNTPLSDGMTYVINTVLDKPLNSSDYKNTTPTSFKKLTKHVPEDIQEIIKVAGEFLL